MIEILTITKKMARNGELVIMPRAEYEKITELKKRLLREEKDTDEAIRIFEQERQDKKLKKTFRFSGIPGVSKKPK